ncbi:MAG TPA: bifunctional riboflavin kinase/FAD synthetase, partial [Flammeovirgaceae bacterium]|nr:bifunctional riboflavin kinase/FAD synthetase [Flammeovirgaceae bacterium]
MKVYEGIAGFVPKGNAIVTSGTFDGVHIGHQKILNTLQDIAAATGGETVLITYWPHPRLVLNPEAHIKLLTTFDEKSRVLEGFGLDHLIKIPFTKEFARTSSLDFIRNILVNGIGTHTLVIGYDHRFGHNREGNFESLKANAANYGFRVEEIPRQDVDNVGVSSTKIRKALWQGDIRTANAFLGWEYCLNGTVVPGAQRGRQIGFPTANIQINDPLKLIPADGVYAVRVILDNKLYRGMLNIGNRPTVDGAQHAIEVHILDFDGNLYDRPIRIKMVARIRPEKRFADMNELR